MIVGIGIDLVSVSRISEKIKGEAFINKVFSPGEIKYCESAANKSQHYAARFAVKEAFLKATGKGLLADLDLKNIEVIKDSSEKPALKLSGAFKKMPDAEGWSAIHVSLSHEGDSAVAIVIIEK